MEQDLIAILDELEALLADANHIPLTGRLMVNEDEAFDLIDRLRAAIPEALRQAERINRERERILNQAREEGEAVVQEAKAYAERMTKESAIVQKAQEEADRILEDARRVSREIRLGARDYASGLLEKVEGNLQKALGVLRQGREELGGSQPFGETEKQPALREQA